MVLINLVFGEGKKQNETKFKQTEMGMIPEDWKTKELNDVLVIRPKNLSLNNSFLYYYLSQEKFL